jgi:hypothetical protein
MLPDDLLNIFAAGILDGRQPHSAFPFAVPLQQSHNGNFASSPAPVNHSLTATLMHVPRFAANVSFVNFNFLTTTTHFHERAGLHGESDPVKDEPCGFLCNSNSPVNLIRTNSVLAIRNHPNSTKPLVKTNRGILKNSSDLNGKLPSGVNALTLPLALILQKNNIIPTASWTSDNSTRPASFLDVFKAGIWIRKVNDSLSKGLQFVVHE